MPYNIPNTELTLKKALARTLHDMTTMGVLVAGYTTGQLNAKAISQAIGLATPLVNVVLLPGLAVIYFQGKEFFIAAHTSHLAKKLKSAITLSGEADPTSWREYLPQVPMKGFLALGLTPGILLPSTFTLAALFGAKAGSAALGISISQFVSVLLPSVLTAAWIPYHLGMRVYLNSRETIINRLPSSRVLLQAGAELIVPIIVTVTLALMNAFTSLEEAELEHMQDALFRDVVVPMAMYMEYLFGKAIADIFVEHNKVILAHCCGRRSYDRIVDPGDDEQLVDEDERLSFAEFTGSRISVRQYNRQYGALEMGSTARQEAGFEKYMDEDTGKEYYRKTKKTAENTASHSTAGTPEGSIVDSRVAPVQAPASGAASAANAPASPQPGTSSAAGLATPPRPSAVTALQIPRTPIRPINATVEAYSIAQLREKGWDVEQMNDYLERAILEVAAGNLQKDFANCTFILGTNYYAQVIDEALNDGLIIGRFPHGDEAIFFAAEAALLDEYGWDSQENIEWATTLGILKKGQDEFYGAGLNFAHIADRANTAAPANRSNADLLELEYREEAAPATPSSAPIPPPIALKPTAEAEAEAEAEAVPAPSAEPTEDANESDSPSDTAGNTTTTTVDTSPEAESKKNGKSPASGTPSANPSALFGATTPNRGETGYLLSELLKDKRKPFETPEEVGAAVASHQLILKGGKYYKGICALENSSRGWKEGRIRKHFEISKQDAATILATAVQAGQLSLTKEHYKAGDNFRDFKPVKAFLEAAKAEEAGKGPAAQ